MKAGSRKHPAGTRLFAEPERPADAYIANVDGASRNNPGPASYGVVVRRPDGAVVQRLAKYIGRKTNNEAEYFGLIAALDYAAAHGITRLRVRSDSELLVNQMRGAYKVKSATLRPLYEQAQKLARRLGWISFEHVPREENSEADKLANEALDSVGRKPSAISPSPQTETRKATAHYVKGVLVPTEPLSLAEGEEVELTIQKKATEAPRHRENKKSN